MTRSCIVCGCPVDDTGDGVRARWTFGATSDEISSELWVYCCGEHQDQNLLRLTAAKVIADAVPT